MPHIDTVEHVPTPQFPYSKQRIAAAKRRMLELHRQKRGTDQAAIAEIAEDLQMTFKSVARVLKRWPTVFADEQPTQVGEARAFSDPTQPAARPLQLPAASIVAQLFDIDADDTIVWSATGDPAVVEDLFDADASWVVFGPWVIAPSAIRHVIRKGEWPDKHSDVQPAIRRTDYNHQQGNLLDNAKALEIEAI